MKHIHDSLPLFVHLYRCVGSVTTPQLMRLVTDLDKRVYRFQNPVVPSIAPNVQIESMRNPVLNQVIAQKSQPAFGYLADQSDLLKLDEEFDENEVVEEEEETADHHLRLSKTGRNHEPSWYLHNINRLCKQGNAQAAAEFFFHKMLTVDRVMPNVNIIHVLLTGLADVGDSNNAFQYGWPFRACTEDIAAWQREHRYHFKLPNGAEEISPALDLELFAGPALERAKGLWIKLHERGYRMSRITYNTLLQALAKAGDLHSSFQALDAMLLGRGGLPSIQSTPPSVPYTCVAEALPPFRPDDYTLNAVLIAIQQSYKAGVLTSPLEALRLALHVWHLIIPRLPHRRPSIHHFTLMAGIAALSETKRSRFSLPSGTRLKGGSTTRMYLEVIPESLPRLRELRPPSCPRLVASGQAAKDLIRQTALLAASDAPHEQIDAPQTSPTLPQYSLNTVPSESSPACSSLLETITLDWNDVDTIMKSPVNLLLPLSSDGVAVQIPSKRDLPSDRNYLAPWQRLSLLGGFEGFLECITAHFKLTQTSTSPLMTKMVALLPPPALDTTSELDRWETAFLKAMKSNGVILDLPIFNCLLQRRTTHGLPVDKLMAIGNRQGLSPDEFTWGCLARGCRTTKDVRNFLSNYSKAASRLSSGSSELPATKTTVRPSLYIYATLMASTKFQWDSKIVILRSLQGSSQLTSRRLKKTKEESKDAPPNDSPIFPNRRFIANLEWEISNFRDLVARGIVPKDGSSVGASDQTGGVIIPPYSLRAFKKFIPIYKEWAERTPIREDIYPVSSRSTKGRGTLKGFDNVTNLIVSDSHERVFSPDRGVEKVPLGLSIIRGQNVALIGEVDEDLDSRIDFENLRAEPLNPVVHYKLADFLFVSLNPLKGFGDMEMGKAIGKVMKNGVLRDESVAVSKLEKNFVSNDGQSFLLSVTSLPI
ncbi:unnamed protein product [Rodentolepis nana]|uniref:Sm domain-containing protein n=1 Tax=Rodentolepis nana TaxID=102285 RepID=A0A0R3T3M9_RODNA|nr:unnamed protein product [Rodentolepis nana]